MTSKIEGSVQVSGEIMDGKHHAEVLNMMRDADGPGGSGDYFNSLEVVDDVPDDEFGARFRALDPKMQRVHHSLTSSTIAHGLDVLAYLAHQAADTQHARRVAHGA